jgi:hypothetical protein
MKKSILAVLLILTVSTFAAFAVTDSGTLNVATQVSGQNEIMVHSIALTKETWAAPANPISATILANEVGSAKQVGYVNVKTNNRKGYALTVTAGKLASDTFEIDYLVNMGSASFNTALASNTSNTITVANGVITGLTVTPYEVSVTVDQTQYDNSPSGTYEGNIYFNYVATT